MTELAKPAGSATLIYGDKSVELPVLAGSTGPDVIDIRKLYGATDAFLFSKGLELGFEREHVPAFEQRQPIAQTSDPLA